MRKASGCWLGDGIHRDALSTTAGRLHAGFLILEADIAYGVWVEQTVGVEISIIFDTAYQGNANGAVWLVESDENRLWFDQRTDLDEWSALFTPEGNKIGDAAVLRSIWNVQEHYPEWARIDVLGVTLTDSLSGDLSDEGSLAKEAEGFSLNRR